MQGHSRFADDVDPHILQRSDMRELWKRTTFARYTTSENWLDVGLLRNFRGEAAKLCEKLAVEETVGDGYLKILRTLPVFSTESTLRSIPESNDQANRGSPTRKEPQTIQYRRMRTLTEQFKGLNDEVRVSVGAREDGTQHQEAEPQKNDCDSDSSDSMLPNYAFCCSGTIIGHFFGTTGCFRHKAEEKEPGDESKQHPRRSRRRSKSSRNAPLARPNTSSCLFNKDTSRRLAQLRHLSLCSFVGPDWIRVLWLLSFREKLVPDIRCETVYTCSTVGWLEANLCSRVVNWSICLSEIRVFVRELHLLSNSH